MSPRTTLPLVAGFPFLLSGSSGQAAHRSPVRAVAAHQTATPIIPATDPSPAPTGPDDGQWVIAGHDYANTWYCGSAQITAETSRVSRSPGPSPPGSCGGMRRPRPWPGPPAFFDHPCR